MNSVDAVAQYEAASAAGDIDALMRTLAPDAELVSPIVANFVIRGSKDLRVLLAAVYGTIHDLKWGERVADGQRVVMTCEAKIGPLRIGDTVIVDLAADGSIERMRPHLRPWLATTFFALRMIPKMARHPGLLRRSRVPAKSRLAIGNLR
jgi:hypothetical protein